MKTLFHFFFYFYWIINPWNVCGYKPVFIIHGILSGNSSMMPMVERIQTKHPGTKVYATDQFSSWSSLRPMWHQINEIGKELMSVIEKHPEGIHLLGYSQGGLIARGILEQFPNHTVNNFISLSSPQAGQYGTKFLHLFFPDLACEEAYELFYSILGQHSSVANYWNDPHHQALFFSYSAFLPYLNNLVISDSTKSYKEGLTKLKNMILIGGPDDEVITPWQSSQFGYFDSNETVVLMKDQGFFKNNSFGLETLHSSNRLKIFELSGNKHIQWHINMTIIDDYILPYLD